MTQLENRICEICEKELVPTSPNQKYHPGKCLYIAENLRRPAAKRMGRTAAIEYYGAMFDDDLLRTIGRSKYMPHLKHIEAWCKKTGRNTFTEREISEGFDGGIGLYKLSAMNRRFGVVFSCGKTETLGSAPVRLWGFSLKHYTGE